jgi:hypothetical protein
MELINIQYVEMKWSVPLLLPGEGAEGKPG